MLRELETYWALKLTCMQLLEYITHHQSGLRIPSLICTNNNLLSFKTLSLTVLKVSSRNYPLSPHALPDKSLHLITYMTESIIRMQERGTVKKDVDHSKKDQHDEVTCYVKSYSTSISLALPLPFQLLLSQRFCVLVFIYSHAGTSRGF